MIETKNLSFIYREEDMESGEIKEEKVLKDINIEIEKYRKEKDVIKKMSLTFNVSKQAMSFRLMDLGYIFQEKETEE